MPHISLTTFLKTRDFVFSFQLFNCEVSGVDLGGIYPACDLLSLLNMF